jgi:hypothetical protein
MAVKMMGNIRSEFEGGDGNACIDGERDIDW